MKADRAVRIMSMLLIASIDVFKREVGRQVSAKLAAKSSDYKISAYSGFKSYFENFDLDLIETAEDRLCAFSEKITEFIETVRDADEMKELQDRTFGFDDDTSARIDAIGESAAHVQSDLEAFYKAIDSARESLDQFTSGCFQIAKEQSEALDESTAHIQDVFRKVLPSVRTSLMTRKHSPDQATEAELALLGLVIGTIVIPDTMLLAIEEEEEDTERERQVWSANLGMAFLSDLTTLYLPNGHVATDGVFDLSRDAFFLRKRRVLDVSNVTDELDNNIQADTIKPTEIHIPPINTGFDQIWQRLHFKADTRQLLWKIGSIVDGKFTINAALPEPSPSSTPDEKDTGLPSSSSPDARGTRPPSSSTPDEKDTELPGKHKLIVHPSFQNPAEQERIRAATELMEVLRALRSQAAAQSLTEAKKVKQDPDDEFIF